MFVLEAGLKRLIGITTIVLVAGVLQPLADAPLSAQNAREQRTRVPEAFNPPAGMCRLWIEGVPASQQPAPTDCANAIRNRPPNASVLFGPQHRGESTEMPKFSSRSRLPLVRQFSPGAPSVRARDDARDRGNDTTAKPAPRKPEKPQ